MIPTPTQLDIDWFWTKVDKNGPVPVHKPELGQCWQWTGYKMKSGHGQYRYGGQIVYVYRFSYYLAHPDFDQALFTLHKCDNGGCVNPDHIFLGNTTDNMADKVTKDRQTKGEDIGTAILSDEEVIQIVSLCRDGKMAQRTIGRKYGVSQTVISRIMNGRRWCHVTEKLGIKPAKDYLATA